VWCEELASQELELQLLWLLLIFIFILLTIKLKISHVQGFSVNHHVAFTSSPELPMTKTIRLTSSRSPPFPVQTSFREISL
jgi:hypothetical protein